MSSVWAGLVRVSHMGDRKKDDPSFHSERDQVAAIESAVPTGGRLDSRALGSDAVGVHGRQRPPHAHARRAASQPTP